MYPSGAFFLVARREDEILPALTFVRPGWAYILERRLPGIHDCADDGATLGRWKLDDDRPHVLGIKVWREIDDVGVGREGLVLPVEQLRPVQQLVVPALVSREPSLGT